MYNKYMKVMILKKIYEVLSTLKNRKLKTNKNLVETHKDMLAKPYFGQDYCSRTARGFYTVGHDSIRLLKWLVYYDRS